MAPILIFLAGPVGRWLVITALVAAVVGGAYFKIKSIGWEPAVSFRQLVEMMVDADLARIDRAIVEKHKEPKP